MDGAKDCAAFTTDRLLCDQAHVPVAAKATVQRMVNSQLDASTEWKTVSGYKCLPRHAKKGRILTCYPSLSKTNR